MKYDIWLALAYEITNRLIASDTKWEQNWWVKKIRSHCVTDWVEWKTEFTMKDVDTQTKVIKEEWAKEEDGKYTKPIVIEYKPDGSTAQDLLGGAMEIKAPWYNSDFDSK
jgi:hypothetical protein